VNKTSEHQIGPQTRQMSRYWSHRFQLFAGIVSAQRSYVTNEIHKMREPFDMFAYFATSCCYEQAAAGASSWARKGGAGAPKGR